MIGAALLAALVGVVDGGASDLVQDDARAHRVAAEQHYLFAPSWTMQLVRTGQARDVAVSFGRPGICPELGLAVVATGEGRVLGVRLEDGAVLWQRRENVVFAGTVSILREPKTGEWWAVTGSEDGTLWALRVRDGAEQWHVELGGISRAPVALARDTLLATTMANRVAHVDIATGEVVWLRGRTRPSTLTVNGHGSAAVDATRVYVGFSDGYVEAYELESGNTVWSRQISSGGAPFSDVDADPVLVGDRLYVASYADGVFALEAKTGEVLWQRRAPAVVSLVGTPDAVVAASADGYVWGLRQEDGRRVFRTRIPAGPVSRMHVRAGLLLLGGGDSGLVVLDAKSGRPLQASPLGSRAGGDPIWRAEDLLILSETGKLFAMRWAAAPNID
ncbi:MAG: PQQ-binding-like beta-propeller repeat protein [Myxococcota bacterium]